MTYILRLILLVAFPRIHRIRRVSPVAARADAARCFDKHRTRAGIRGRKLESQRRFDRQAARYSPVNDLSAGRMRRVAQLSSASRLSASQLNVARSHVHLATRVRQLLPRDERARSVIVVVHQRTGSIGTPGRDATNRFRSSG